MEAIETTQAPSAIGIYSQAVKKGSWVFLSGQIGLVPESMHMIEGGVSAQIKQVFENLSAVCQAAGGSLSDIVKLNVYLVDLGHFQIVNETMAQYFSKPYPSRAAVEVSALPKGALIEMDGIMVSEK